MRYRVINKCRIYDYIEQMQAFIDAGKMNQAAKLAEWGHTELNMSKEVI